MAFNSLTDQGLAIVLTRAPRGVSLDLEGIHMVFAPESVDSLWKDRWEDKSVLRHLNVSGNAPDLLGYTHLFWMAGRSRLETFDAAMDLTHEGICAPTRLLLFGLANRFL